MKIRKIAGVAIILILATALFASLAACSPKQALYPFEVTAKKGVTSSSLSVKKVENLADDFILGMDASSVVSLEASGVKFCDFDGKETDVFKVLADNGVNTIRVRVWNNPFDKNGNGYGGGNCTIDTAVEIGKRATKYKMNLMVDFHYSDFWADPAKQKAPKAWSNLGVDEKAEALYNFTKDSLQKLCDEKIRVSLVQVGNETNNGLVAGETKWENSHKLFAAGAKAVREVCPKARVILHFANPEKAGNYDYYAKMLKQYNVDYDVFATSYYPYWHGTLTNLQQTLSHIAETYGKKVMVAETSYAYTDKDSDFHHNTISDKKNIVADYPFSVQGQADSVRNVIDIIAHTTGGIGVCYWEGTWIGVGKQSFQQNKQLWEKFGSGWASSYSAEYDPDDAGKFFGGSAVDNQAMFDADGKPLESLKVFALVHTGNNR